MKKIIARARTHRIDRITMCGDGDGRSGLLSASAAQPPAAVPVARPAHRGRQPTKNIVLRSASKSKTLESVFTSNLLTSDYS